MTVPPKVDRMASQLELLKGRLRVRQKASLMAHPKVSLTVHPKEDPMAKRRAL